MNIYVGNLAYSIDEEDLRNTFGEYGEVISTKIITDRDTGHSKGFAFVEMSDDSSGSSAIDSLNEQELAGRQLKVSQAKPRTNNSDRSNQSRW